MYNADLDKWKRSIKNSITKETIDKLKATIDLEEGEQHLLHEAGQEDEISSQGHIKEELNIYNYLDLLPTPCRRKYFIHDWEFTTEAGKKLPYQKIAILGPAGTGKTLAALYKIMVEYPKRYCKLTKYQRKQFRDKGEMPEITMKSLFVREELEAAYDTLVMPLKALYDHSKGTFFTFYKVGPKSVKLIIAAHIEMIDGIPTRIINLIDIKVFDTPQKTRGFRGTEYHTSLISEPENHREDIFQYVPLRCRNARNIKKCGTDPINMTIIEGQTPPPSNAFFQYFETFGEVELNDNEMYGFRRIKKIELPGRDYVGYNMMHVCASGLSPKPENWQIMGSDYWIKAAAQSRHNESFVKKNIVGIPVEAITGEEVYTTFDRTFNVGKVDFNSNIPITLISDADHRGVCLFVQAYLGQIRILDAVFYDEYKNIQAFVSSIIDKLRNVYTNAKVGNCFIDPAANRTASFIKGKYSPVAELNEEFERQRMPQVRFQPLGHKANDMHHRIECGNKLFMQIQDGRPGCMINDKMPDINRVVKEIIDFKWPLSDDGTIKRGVKPIKTTTADCIGYCGYILSMGEFDYANVIRGKMDDTDIYAATLKTGQDYSQYITDKVNRFEDNTAKDDENEVFLGGLY